MSLGSLLKSGRKSKGLTQRQLAERVGAKVNSIIKYEKAGEPDGNFPPVPMLAKLATVLGIPAGSILAETLENHDDRMAMQKPVREVAKALVEIYTAMADAAAEIDANIHHAQHLILQVFGTLDAIPSDIQALAARSHRYALFVDDKNAPEHAELGHAENSTTAPVTDGKTSANKLGEDHQ